jgi:hypothetical protein
VYSARLTAADHFVVVTNGHRNLENKGITEWNRVSDNGLVMADNIPLILELVCVDNMCDVYYTEYNSELNDTSMKGRTEQKYKIRKHF